MKTLIFLKGILIAIFAFLIVRAYDPIMQGRPFLTTFDWFDGLLIILGGLGYYYVRQRKANSV